MAEKKAVKEKKFDYKSIKTYEDACKKLGIDPLKLPEVSNIPEEFAKPLIAVFKIMIIFKAINNGWTPDWNNSNQYKYYPWYWVLSSGFGFGDSHCNFTHSNTAVGSRLCTYSAEKALYIAKQFEAEYKDFFLYPEK